MRKREYKEHISALLLFLFFPAVWKQDSASAVLK